MYRKEKLDCYCEWDGSCLRLGNALIEKSWKFTNGQFTPASLTRVEGTNWLMPNEKPAFSHPVLTDGEAKILAVTADDTAVGLLIRIEIAYQSANCEWRHWLYAKQPLIRSEIIWMKADGLQAQVETPDVLDYIPLRPLHVECRCLAFTDVTDRHNNLLAEKRWLRYPNESISADGNIFCLRDNINGECLTIIKEGPTAQGRMLGQGADFIEDNKGLAVLGSGLQGNEFLAGPITTYGVATIVSQGAEYNHLQALSAYHQCIAPAVPDRDYFIMSNTWGDRSQNAKICESFIMKEIECAAELGVQIVQIDDGWQKGRSINWVGGGGTWKGFYISEPDYWEIDKERFPEGFGNIARFAEEKGVKLGLWFAPDSADDFAYWERDVETLFNFYQKYGLRHFKLDGVKFTSKRSEDNLVKMMTTLRAKSNDEIHFNLDVTAGVRPGYLGRNWYGSLFVENRYSDWHNYFPHWTLRNLWQLSAYVPTRRLQFELLNVERNQHLYIDDPLSPKVCGQEYAAAVTLAANPLVWMEMSNLTEEQNQALKRVFTAYLPVQKDFLNGLVLPLGDEPSGTSWTGFQSIGKNGGYLLVYRELAEAKENVLPLWGDFKLGQLHIIGGSKYAAVEAVDCGVRVTLPEVFNWCLIHYRNS